MAGGQGPREEARGPDSFSQVLPPLSTGRPVRTREWTVALTALRGRVMACVSHNLFFLFKGPQGGMSQPDAVG